MDDRNASPEPFLKGMRRIRPPAQVSPASGCGQSKKYYATLPSPSQDSRRSNDDLEPWGPPHRVKVPGRELDGEAYLEKGADEIAEDDTRSSGFTRHESYMPRHPKSEVNPFINQTMRLPWHQYVKMIIVGVTLLPFRVIFTILNVFVMWFFASCILAGLSEGDIERPFNRWRLALKYPICWCLRFQTFLFGFWWIRVKGKCAAKEEAPIIVANHVSPFEPFYLVGKTMATPVQRVEDARAPIFGTIQKAMQVMFVDRANPASKKKCLQTIEERSDPQSRFPQVMVFPEGTCTNQRALITFKHGPFIPGQSVQPVIIRYHFRFLDPSYPAVAPSLVALALRVMCQVWNCMEVEYLPVYVPTLEDRDYPRVFASHVQEYMSKRLGVPATQHAFEDVALQFQAMKMNLDPEVAVVEWARVRESLNIDAGTAKEYLILFFEMDKDRDGKLSLEEFCAPWRQKRDEEAERQFQATVSAARRRARLAFEEMRGRGDNSPTDALRAKSAGATAAASSASGMRENGSDASTMEGRSAVVNGEEERVGSDEEAAAAAAAATLPGLLREEEMERAYEIFKGEEELDFRKFLTGLGVLGGLTREGRTGLFKFIFSMLQERRDDRPLRRRDVERFIRRLRPELTAKDARQILDESMLDEVVPAGGSAEQGEEVAGEELKDSRVSARGDKRAGDRMVTRPVFLNFAEKNGSILSIYQAMLLNDILGVQRDIAEFGLTAGEDFGGLALDTTELERTLDELVGPAALV